MNELVKEIPDMGCSTYIRNKGVHARTHTHTNTHMHAHTLTGSTLVGYLQIFAGARTRVGGKSPRASKYSAIPLVVTRLLDDL